MKVPRLFLLATLLVAAAVSLGTWPNPGHADTPILVALDMDPTGNSCPGDGVNDCTLGPINSCVSVDASDSITFDVVLDDLPLRGDFEGLANVDLQLLWGGSVVPAEPDVLDITARTDISPTIHLLAQATGSMADLWELRGHALPVLAPPYLGGINDIGAPESNPPWTQGTAWRGTVTVDAAAANGFYKLEFADPWADPFGTGVGNNLPTAECIDEWGAGCTLQNAIIAVGQPCPSVGGITELHPDGAVPPTGLADASSPGSPPYAALVGGLAAAVLAFVAGGWYARRRWLQRS